MRSLVAGAYQGALLLLLLLAPLPLGSVNTEWRMPLAAAGLALGFLGVAGPAFVKGRVPRVPLILLPLAAFVAWTGLQALPLPRGLVEFVSPERLRLPAVQGASGATTLSVYPGATLELFVFHLSLFFLLLAFANSGSRAPFRVLAIAAFCHAVFAGVLSEMGGTASLKVLWVYPLPEVLTPFGTYVNKNHFAGLMILGAGASLAILVRRWSFALRRTQWLGWRATASALAGRGFFRLLAPAIGFAVIVLALFGSGSRGAALALSAALLVVPLVSTWIRGRLRLWPLALCGGGLVLLALLATLGTSTSLFERFVPEGRYMNRPRVWKATVTMWEAFPVAGTGLGSYLYVFPRSQSFAPDREFTHAEGDWVQILAETGLVGALALLAFAAALVRRVVSRLGSTARGSALTTGATVGLLGIVLHGFLDVSLHIPANMVAATFLLGGLVGIGPARRDAEA